MLPQGYDTVLGEGGGTLSGGERQRLSIARAIMKDAPVIILDEATANVEPENEQELMEAIGELTREKTVIMIAHRLKTVRNARFWWSIRGGLSSAVRTTSSSSKTAFIAALLPNASRRQAGRYKREAAAAADVLPPLPFDKFGQKLTIFRLPAQIVELRL